MSHERNLTYNLSRSVGRRRLTLNGGGVAILCGGGAIRRRGLNTNFECQSPEKRNFPNFLKTNFLKTAYN